jgi:hypothetical protein
VEGGGLKVTTASWLDKEALKSATRVVSISRGDPKWIKPEWKIWEFCPSWFLINGWRDKSVDEKEYRAEFLCQVVGHTLQRGIDQVQDGDVLCCWEKSGFCHRDIVADFLDAAGIEVTRR